MSQTMKVGFDIDNYDFTEYKKIHNAIYEYFG